MKRISRFLVPIFVLMLFLSVRLLAYTGEIIKSFSTPGGFPTGLTWDGKYLWLADRKDYKIYCIDPSDGQVVRFIESPAYWPMGLAWDGKALWNIDIKGGLPLTENYDGKVYRIDPMDGTILRTIQAPSKNPRGLTWDGKYLWCVDNKEDVIIQFSPEDGTTIREIKAPARDPRGLTFDGKYLWVSDRMTDEIYMIDPVSGSTLLITFAPGLFTRGLTFDGMYLWATDYQSDKIFQMKIRDEEHFIKYNEHPALVTLTHQITNFGPGIVKQADINIAIPTERVSQNLVDSIEYEPMYSDIITDKWGQQTAHYKLVDIQPGEQRNLVMKVNVTTSEVRYFIFPDEVGSLKDIPKDILKIYLEDHEKYQITHPVIQNAVKEAVGGEKNPYWIARGIFDYIRNHMYYEMAGGWNTAPTVLARGNGSCSEYSFVYIAMCRAAGLPARYVGSVVIRGDDAALDDVFHRWVEVYIPGYDWIPVDPSGGDRDLPRDQTNYFGHLANRFLITTQSGGGSQSMEWTYNFNETWITEPKTLIITDHFAEWEPIETIE
ncbi:transglutaminase domain-containing protein [candidate division KSB1 bacterium]